MRQTSKCKHLPYLYVGTLRGHYYIYSLKTIESWTKKNSIRTPSWITKPAGQLGACVESCGKVPPKLLPLGPRSHECDDKPTKIERYLNLPKLLMSGQKIGCIINKWQFCAAKLAKSVNYARSTELYSENRVTIMLVTMNYAEDYASSIYRSLIMTQIRFSWALKQDCVLTQFRDWVYWILNEWH